MVWMHETAARLRDVTSHNEVELTIFDFENTSYEDIIGR